MSADTYPCARVGCARRAIATYQTMAHAAIYGACAEHLPGDVVRWVGYPECMAEGCSLIAGHTARCAR